VDNHLPKQFNGGDQTRCETKDYVDQFSSDAIQNWVVGENDWLAWALLAINLRAMRKQEVKSQ
jgi:hypothetical protein